MIRGPAEIREAYQDEDVARRYIDERFRQPLGALLHDRQVAAVTALIRLHRLRRILEIAPGPARLTVEVAALPGLQGTILDASAAMLVEARRRLSATNGRSWRFIQGDVFHLPFRESFDLVYAFRLIRHFESADRDRIYRQVASIVRPGGYLVFDAVNEIVSAPLRARAGAGEYAHYDALLRPDSIRAELASHGLQLEQLVNVQRRYSVLHQLQVLVAPRSRTLARLAMEIVDRFGGGEPLEWVVTCRRV